MSSRRVLGKAGVYIDRNIERWIYAAHGTDFCRRFEQANRLWWKLPIAVSWDGATELYGVSDLRPTDPDGLGAGSIKIARRERVMRYRRGVADRIRRLARKYFIDRMSFVNGDVVIDCGANVGEVGLYVRSQADVDVVAIEPSTLEAGACDQNLFDGRPCTRRMALWHSLETLKFYDSNVTGDSSLIEPAHFSGETTVDATTLDRIASELDHGRWIKLLKIEGEGAEPEILAGGQSMIRRVIHCTIDCGPERGTSEDHVIPQVCNFMFAAEFELMDVNLERQIFWFRNRAEPSATAGPGS